MRNGGSIVELHVYASPQDKDPGQIRKELIARMHELYPETKNARILEERFLLRQDCPAFKPGSHEHRPSVQTPDPGLVLAGDFVRMPIPCALMEKAAASGMLAANNLLSLWDVKGEDLYSIPTKGLTSFMPAIR